QATGRLPAQRNARGRAVRRRHGPPRARTGGSRKAGGPSVSAPCAAAFGQCTLCSGLRSVHLVQLVQGLGEAVGPQLVEAGAFGPVRVAVGAGRTGAAARHQLAARTAVVVREPEHVTGLVRGDADRVVLLVLRVVEEDVAVAVAVGGGVGPLGVAALVVGE